MKNSVCSSKDNFDYIIEHNAKQPPFSLNTLTDVRKILMNEKYCGDEILPSKISNDLFKAVQEKIRTWTKSNESQFLLSGLAKCGECGLALRYKGWRPKDKDNKRYTAYRIVCSQNNVKNRNDRPSHKGRKCNFNDGIDAFDLENNVLNMVLESKKISADEELILKDYFDKISKNNWDDIINKENLEFTRKCRNILLKYIEKIKVKSLDEIDINFKKCNNSVTSEIHVNCKISISNNNYTEERDNLFFA